MLTAAEYDVPAKVNTFLPKRPAKAYARLVVLDAPRKPSKVHRFSRARVSMLNF